MCFFLAVAVLLVIVIINNGLSVRRAIQGAIIAGSLIALWEWEVHCEAENDW